MIMTNTIARLPILAALVAVVAAALPGCTAVQSPVQNDLDVPGAVRAVSNTAQNIQVWPDGTAQATAAQPDSGDVSDGRVYFQGTGLSAQMAVGVKGIALRNPGDLRADEVVLTFGAPIEQADGVTVTVPIEGVTITGLENTVSDPIDALSAQVSTWAGVLEAVAEDQRAAVIAALERDAAITTEVAAALRAAFGIVPDLVGGS